MSSDKVLSAALPEYFEPLEGGAPLVPGDLVHEAFAKLDGSIIALQTELADVEGLIADAVSAEVTDRNTAISSAIATEVTNRNTAIATVVSNQSRCSILQQYLQMQG